MFETNFHNGQRTLRSIYCQMLSHLVDKELTSNKRVDKEQNHQMVTMQQLQTNKYQHDTQITSKSNFIHAIRKVVIENYDKLYFRSRFATPFFVVRHQLFKK